MARLRAYGEVVPDWSRADAAQLHDLAAFENGGQAIATNDQHFGSMHNLLLPGRGKDMGDGWETRRRRGPGHDFVVLRLGHRGAIERVELDTAHFKGNYPDRASLRATLARPGAEPDAGTMAVTSESWPELLPEQKLEADHVHVWTRELAKLGAVSHVRLDIYPDGGVSRLRLWGRLARAGAGAAPSERAMSGELREWLHLALRWTHVVAGAFWIGQTAFFTWLDAQSRRAIDRRPRRRRTARTSGWCTAAASTGWSACSQPERVPGKLHWFKWEAAASWVSGILLLNLVYYHGGAMVARRLARERSRRRRDRGRRHRSRLDRLRRVCGCRRSSAASRSAPRSRSRCSPWWRGACARP